MQQVPTIEKGFSSKSHDRLQFSMPTLEDKAEAEAQGPFEQRRWCISTGQSYLRVYAHIVQGNPTHPGVHGASSRSSSKILRRGKADNAGISLVMSLSRFTLKGLS
ncbi:uncharacterized protein LOC112639779 [Camponotus floridanus]|uniref:uncharacterized protein LOC112639779 n=1 Tax=Camponotus floridanus TaxID=104421 RepID=UPI000DC67CDA|nr:uncharacterized protein LOC112639779 [Camponotus floridanus]